VPGSTIATYSAFNISSLKDFAVQIQLRHKLVAIPEGIFLDDQPLHKCALISLPERTLFHLYRATEIFAKMTDKDWEPPAPHGFNDIPLRAQMEMHLALAKPGSLNKYNSNQPRCPNGEWGCGPATDQHTAKVPPPLKNPEKYVGHSYLDGNGYTECAIFPQKVAGAPNHKDWVPGDYISPENPPPVGTWVATFGGKNEGYEGHVGAFSHFDKDGNLYLYDQFDSKQKVTLTVYHHKPAGWVGHISNNPANYRILKW
jgi:hypothetical protein